MIRLPSASPDRDPATLAVLRLLAWVGSLGAVLLGCAVVTGWAINSHDLQSVRPGLSAMSPITAASFILAGLSLTLQLTRRPRAALLPVPLLVALMLAVLASHLARGTDVLDPWIEHRVFPAATGIGLCAPVTCLDFLLLAAALLGQGRAGRRPGLLVACCASTGLVLTGLALLGYAYGVEDLYAIAFYHRLALHTATGLFLLFLAALAADPARFWIRIFASSRPSGAVTRIQLLLATAVPFAGGLLLLTLIRARQLAPGLAMALLVVITMLPLVVRILLDGRQLDRLERQRRVTVIRQQRDNAMLERRVRERTALLGDSEAQLRSFFDNAPEGLMLLRLAQDGSYLVEAANAAMSRIYGLGPEQMQGAALAGLAPAPALVAFEAQIAQCLATGKAARYAVRRIISGVARVFDVILALVPQTMSGVGRLIIVSARDVTEAESRADQLRQSQKMEAVGQLTGGIAHDFNNLLAGIAGSLEMLQRGLAQGRTTGLGRYIEAAQSSAGRAASLTHRLLAFSRRQTLDPRPVLPDRLVAGMQPLIRGTIGPEIGLVVTAGPGGWSVLCDENQLENAVLNLCINARDAMPGGGRLGVDTANLSLDLSAAELRELAPGDYVAISVSDTGAGMTPEVIARAFDPFFTTKPLGQGTGLGLSMIYGFVKQSGGQVRIHSQPGAGTTVRIILPRSLLDARGPPLPQYPAVPLLADAGQSVVVVDDEATIRMLAVEALQELGYATQDAGDGGSGLQLLRAPGRVDLLITDVGLPGGMNGRQLADAAREVRPGLKILFITGYAEFSLTENGRLGPGMHVLVKPFTMTQLAERTRAIIAEG